MKPPDTPKTRIVNVWPRKAEADFGVAQRMLGDKYAYLNAITFHCQQAAEKYIRAVLTFWDIEFPKTHIMAKLLGLVETRDAALAESLFDAVVLTPYAMDLRYPGDRPDASPAQAREAVELARLVRDKVLLLLGR